jgi:hypothetical protein
MTTLADEMKAHALEAQRFSRKHLVLELDFSEASIQQLENQADSVGFALRGGSTPENIELLTRIWGAYLGESLRKATGAEWVLETAGQVRRIGLRGPTTVVHPHEQVHRRLTGTKDPSLSQYFQQSREQLKS